MEGKRVVIGVVVKAPGRKGGRQAAGKGKDEKGKMIKRTTLKELLAVAGGAAGVEIGAREATEVGVKVEVVVVCTTSVPGFWRVMNIPFDPSSETL